MNVFSQLKSMDRKKVGKETLAFFRHFFNSYPFYIFQLLLACAFVFLHKEVEGALVFALLISAILIVCDDILPTTLPFLMISIFTTNCYDSFDQFIGLVIFAPIPVAAFLYHFIFYRKPIRFGDSVWGLFAVGFAVTLGGFGGFTLKEYARGSYYILGLGFGMLGTYYLMKSEFAPQRKYDIKERFSVIMCLAGSLCVAMILIGYFQRSLGWKFPYYAYGFSPNNLSTNLMFAMPFGLYLSKKNRYFAVFAPIMYLAICLTGSRGGFLFGTVEFWVCCVYWVLQGKRRTLRLFVCIGVNILILSLFGTGFLTLLLDRLGSFHSIKSEVRYTMILQSIENFCENPLVGTGILDDSIAYGDFNKQGTMTWYHMMIPQIVGSMGLLGIVAYGYQFYGRVKLIFTKPNTWSLCLGISYLGVLLMSQVNPGEFCPLPFTLLAVLLFIFQENRLERHCYPLWNQPIS